MPKSATDAWIAYLGLLIFFPGCVVIRQFAWPTAWYLTAVLALPAAAIISLEAVYIGPSARQNPRLQFQHWQPHWSAVCCKLVGLGAIKASIGCAQFILHEYSKDMYRFWFEILRDVGPWACLVCAVYVVVADGCQTDAARQEDLYYNLGRLLLRQRLAGSIPRSRWAGLAREWMVKAFFLPLMTSAFARSYMDFDNTMQRFWDLLTSQGLAYGPLYSTLHDAICLVDVVWATFGYALSCTLLDSHVRSVEPTILGWAAALACYPPFNASIIDAYLLFGGPSNNWQEYLQGAPPWCQALWGGAVLLLIGIYSWSTVVFGLRFSNLTNRGIITSGPYSFTRHPAYVAKNLSWWLENVPWSMHDGPQMAFKRCLRLAGVNALYALRAWTEEQHLLKDPDYVEYFNAVQQKYGLTTLQPPGPRRQEQQQEQHANV